MKINLITCFLLFFCWGCENQKEKIPFETDIIIYGGTSSAIIAGEAAKQMGKSVMVISPDINLSGLSACGLGFTDTGNKAVIGGMAREFYHRIYKKYQQEHNWEWQEKADYGNKGQGTPAIDGEQRTIWIFEPHIAEEVFEDLVSESGLIVFRDEWLNRAKTVETTNGQINALTTISGKVSVLFALLFTNSHQL